MPQSVKSTKAGQDGWLSWLGCHSVNHTKKVVGSISSQGTNLGWGMNLLWDTNQIGGKSYILFSKTSRNLSPEGGIHHSQEFFLVPYCILPQLYLEFGRSAPACYFSKWTKFHLAPMREIVIDSKLNWKNSHKFFLVASLHYFKKTDHPQNHHYQNTFTCISNPSASPFTITHTKSTETYWNVIAVIMLIYPCQRGDTKHF